MAKAPKKRASSKKGKPAPLEIPLLTTQQVGEIIKENLKDVPKDTPIQVVILN